MLGGITFNESDVAKCLKQVEDGLFGNDVTALAESEQEMLAFIQNNGRSGVRTTMKSLLSTLNANLTVGISRECCVL